MLRYDENAAEARPSGSVSVIETLVPGVKYSCILLMAVIGVLLLMPSLAKGRVSPGHVSDSCATPDAAVVGSSPCSAGDGLQTGQQGSWVSRAAVSQPSLTGVTALGQSGRPQGEVSTAAGVTITGDVPRGTVPGPTVRRRWWHSGVAAIPQWLWTGWTFVNAGVGTDRADRPYCAARHEGLITWPPASSVPQGTANSYSLFSAVGSGAPPSDEGSSAQLPATLQLLGVTSYDPTNCNVVPAVCWPGC